MISDYKRLLFNFDFTKLWLSQLLSQVTINIINFLLLIRLYKLTGSSFSNSLLWIFYSLPALLVGPFASTAVDMTDRRRVLMFSNILQAVVIILFMISYTNSLFLTYAVVFTYSLLNQFYVPSEAASLPLLVKKADLAEANSLFLITQQGAIIFGITLAGFMNHYFGFDNSLLLCSIFMFLAFLSVSFLPPLVPLSEERDDYENRLKSFMKRTIEGYKFLKNNTNVLFPFSLLLGLWVGLNILIVSVPAIASEILKVNVDHTGLYLILPTGIGAALSSILVPKMLKKGTEKSIIVKNSLYGLAGLLLLIGVVVPNVSHTLSLIFAFTATIFIGAFFVGVFIPTQVYIQEFTPDRLRGRIFGSFWFLVTASTMIPIIFSGAISQLFGVKMVLVLLDLFILLAIYLFRKNGAKIFEMDIREAKI